MCFRARLRHRWWMVLACVGGNGSCTSDRVSNPPRKNLAVTQMTAVNKKPEWTRTHSNVCKSLSSSGQDTLMFSKYLGRRTSCQYRTIRGPPNTEISRSKELSSLILGYDSIRNGIMEFICITPRFFAPTIVQPPLLAWRHIIPTIP